MLHGKCNGKDQFACLWRYDNAADNDTEIPRVTSFSFRDSPKPTVRYNGKPVLTADIDFSISENPNFRFWFLPSADGSLKAEVVDTKDLSFSSEFIVKLGGAGG